jgi:hypothetical protein
MQMRFRVSFYRQASQRPHSVLVGGLIIGRCTLIHFICVFIDINDINDSYPELTRPINRVLGELLPSQASRWAA